MNWNNGLLCQINKLEPIQFKPLTMEDLTETLMKTQVKSVNYNSIYIGSDAYDMFWDITYKKNSIDVYGVKQISKQGELFVYEGIIFDRFPEKYHSLYIEYYNEFDNQVCEELELIELSDTKIVFSCSLLPPEERTNIKIQWI